MKSIVKDYNASYSNIEGEKIIPLFIRYRQKSNNNDSSISDKDIIEQISGIHTCYFVHHKQKVNGNYSENITIKFDEQPYSITAQLSDDEITLRVQIIDNKNIVLPEENDLFKVQMCLVRFVDYKANTFNLIRDLKSPYWFSHSEEITQFLKDCFALEVPPIEIQIEKDKEMWQAYLDGLKALLENKRDLIRIQSVNKQKDGLLRLDFDMDSYAQNLKNAIWGELEGKYNQNVQINIENKKCSIKFDSYQKISEETIDKIKTIGKDYCYSVETAPVNIVSGSISIVSDQAELESIIIAIEKELEAFGVSIDKDEYGEFHLLNDKSVEILKKIVDIHYNGIATVVNTTKIHMPLLPRDDSVNIEKLKEILPEQVDVEQYGKHFVVSSKRPLDLQMEIFKNMKFSSSMVKVVPKCIDPNIQIEGATIKDNAYSLIINNFSDLSGIGKLFYDVRKLYPDQYLNSTYYYAFVPQINRGVLQELKLCLYGNKSIVVDVPRSYVTFSPKSADDYEALKADFFAHLDSSVSAVFPEYAPTAKIDFLCENEEYRHSVFEKVNIALADKISKFTENNLNRDARMLTFKFIFDSIDERNEIENILHKSLSHIHGIKIVYNDDNNKGVTTWSLSEDASLLRELENKLQHDFKDEDVNYISAKGYDKLNNDDSLNNSSHPKDNVKKKKINEYLKENSQHLGKCIRRGQDNIIVKVDDDILQLIQSKRISINKGDYIQFPAKGEAMELTRQNNAMNRILKPKYNNSPINQNLPSFIFDPKYAEDIAVNIEETKEDIRANKISNLNEKQLEAVAKSVLAKDLALIQGPPGTGKTTVIAEIIWQEIRRNPKCRILLTSQTNLAVDNALERLQGRSGIRPVRIGQLDRLEPEGLRFSLPIIENWAKGIDKYPIKDGVKIDTTDNATKIWIDSILSNVSNNPKYADIVCEWKSELNTKDELSRNEFTQLYKNNVNLVAATCSVCGSSDFYYAYTDLFGGDGNMYFDVVIMDEASKATPLEMAVPLVLGKKIIVIGDHKQLPPMMDENTIDSALERIGRKDIAEKLQKVESQFGRLFDAASKVRKTIVSTLDTQYRMHEQIMNTIKQFYQEELSSTGGLKCGIKDTMDIADFSNKGSRWHGITLNPIIQPSTHAVWIDVNTPETALNPGYRNDGELKAIELVLKVLEQADGYKEFIDAQQKPEDKEIGIITFYSAQSRKIKEKYKAPKYRVNVVDKFQGMERNIIIVSTVRSNPDKNIGFAKQIERINVAFSRARRLLIVVGNKRQFAHNSNYAASIANMETVPFEQLKASVR